jgi:hypothetical protein
MSWLVPPMDSDQVDCLILAIEFRKRIWKAMLRNSCLGGKCTCTVMRYTRRTATGRAEQRLD